MLFDAPLRSVRGAPEIPFRPGPRLVTMSSRVLTAVAWPYANGPRHIGHVSGFGVPSDVFSRYRRMAGDKVLMVSGTDEHGTPIQVQADAEGLTAARARRQVQPRDRRGPAGPRAVLRPVHPHHHRATTTRSCRSCSWRCTSNGYVVAEDADGRDQPVDRPHAARPLHRGHLPDLRLRRRARRPVRQLRQPARPGRPDQPALEDQRRDAGVRRDRALLPRPARVRRVARAAGCPPAPTGGRTCSSSPRTWSTTSSRARSPATSTGACRSRSTAGATSR